VSLRTSCDRVACAFVCRKDDEAYKRVCTPSVENGSTSLLDVAPDLIAVGELLASPLALMSRMSGWALEQICQLCSGACPFHEAISVALSKQDPPGVSGVSPSLTA
jgi:hypothetical protein